MRKNIDIDDTVLRKVKMLSVFEDISVKALMEKAVRFYVQHREQERLNALSKEEKEDLGLLLLMQQADSSDTVSEEDVFDYLDK
jgi:hypothetical protein